MIGRVTVVLLILGALVAAAFLFGNISYIPSGNSLSAVGSQKELLHLTADVWGLFDPQTGEILAGSNTDSQKPIASVTKLFTAYAAMQSSSTLNTEFRILWRDLNVEGEAGRLSYGELMTNRRLLFPLLIVSSNDAGAAIRRTLGPDFSESQTALIKNLGLESTVIVDGTGLSPDNRSTVRDLARFYAYLREAQPYIVDITQLNMYIAKNNGWINNNPARTLESYRGGKHGFITEAKTTFVGSFMVGEKETGVVLLGSSDLLADIRQLIEYAKSI